MHLYIDVRSIIYLDVFIFYIHNTFINMLYYLYSYFNSCFLMHAFIIIINIIYNYICDLFLFGYFYLFCFIHEIKTIHLFI